ncbi:hypothetical protein [Labilibaculum sp.]|uniref:hypothetical protein n=1 Tax=Labilibaculum sp. TaxID=2060723 RepID=UPI002AA89141|nr:hypothetical protein [Labilibaculum sp.]
MNFYKIVSVTTSVLFIYLTIQLVFMSDSFVSGMGLQPSETASVLAKRAAMFMLGISILMFASRNLTPSKARQIICIATGITLFGLAFMGSYEFIRGSVNSSIFIAIGFETVLWISFGIILLKNRIGHE